MSLTTDRRLGFRPWEYLLLTLFFEVDSSGIFNNSKDK